MNSFIAAVLPPLLCCLTGCDPQVTIGDPDAGANGGSVVNADAGSDPALGLWSMYGTVTSAGGSRFRARFTAAVRLVDPGEYQLEGGACRTSMMPGIGGLRSRPGATTSCSPSFLTIHFDDGSPLTLDSIRPIRIDVADATLAAWASTCTLNGRGQAGFADGSLVGIDFALSGTR
jgi:hypothetical protein